MTRCKAFRDIPSGAAKAAKGHMPFEGHRTVATFLAQQDAAKQRVRPGRSGLQRAMEYGFDPECLKRSAR